jgi:cation diffusion facilitator family transporter
MYDREREYGIYKVTVAGSIVNFALVLFKFIAGVLGNSSAMIADAVHSLSDFVTDVIVVVFVRISSKPKDKSHDYGHGKFETFATLLVCLTLLFVGLGIAWSGGKKIFDVLVMNEDLAPPGILALLAAVVSIVSKEILYQYTIICGRKLKSDAVTANAWHHRSDAFSSIASAIGIAGAIILGAQWTILDPLAALFVSFFIVRIAFKLMRPCLDELLEKSLPDEIENEIAEIVLSFDGVSDLHNMFTRKIGNNCAIEFHIRMDGATSLAEAHDKVSLIELQLKERYGRGIHVIIHTEPVKLYSKYST